MRLASFALENRHCWGVIEGDHIVDIGAVLHAQARTLKEFLSLDWVPLAHGAIPAASRYPLGTVRWLPVIVDPAKILCVGLNYEDHRRETGRDVSGYPTIFTRFANSQIGHDEPLIRPAATEELDYEGELALVIGKAGRHISREAALDHVAGYSCYNDVSVRDWQRHTTQFTPGKNFPATGAFGPWLVTPDELPDIGSLSLTTRLNGVVMQQAHIDQMIFDIPTIISYCSGFTALEPGDVIVTGTPGGVGMKRTPPRFMDEGDIVEVEISSVGVLTNPVLREQPVSSRPADRA